MRSDGVKWCARHAHAGNRRNMIGLQTELFGDELVGRASRLDHRLDEFGVVAVPADFEHVFEEDFFAVFDSRCALLVGVRHGPLAAAQQRRAADKPHLFDNKHVEPRLPGEGRRHQPAAARADDHHVGRTVPFFRRFRRNGRSRRRGQTPRSGGKSQTKEIASLHRASSPRAISRFSRPR